MQYIANVFKFNFSNRKVKIFNSLDEFQPIENVVVTIGTFDGVHFGHQQLIQRVKQKAAEINGSSLILTFFPHPRMILYPEEHGIELLNTIREKQALLEQEGIDNLLILPFDATFAEISSEEFIRKILVEKLKTKVLIIGYDHRFGKNREGSIDDLLKFAPECGFEVEQIPEQDVNEIAVSSTQIRKSLKRGDVATTAAFLGRPYTLTGTVVQGNKIGRTIGFPTANLQIVENYKLIPSEGVYVTKVEVGSEEFYGMLRIGRRPTLESAGKLSIEVFILDFNREIYGSEVTLHLLAWVREDRKFNSLEDLTRQIKNDLNFTLNYLK